MTREDENFEKYKYHPSKFNKDVREIKIYLFFALGRLAQVLSIWFDNVVEPILLLILHTEFSQMNLQSETFEHLANPHVIKVLISILNNNVRCKRVVK